MPSQSSRGQRVWRGVLGALAFGAATVALSVVVPEASAQTDVPEAPTAVAVYSIRSTELEVALVLRPTRPIPPRSRFSGSREARSSTPPGQMTSDPATSIESDQSTSAGDRYVDIITGLTDGTEYTVRVIAASANGDGDPSAEATGTPATTPGEPREFIENEVVGDLREFPSLAARNMELRCGPEPQGNVLFSGSGGSMGVRCSPNAPMESNLRKCYVSQIFFGMSTIDLIRVITHELAHVYTLSNGVTSAAAPLGVGAPLLCLLGTEGGRWVLLT